MTRLLDQIDFLICMFFLYDFFLRLYRAESKLEFLKWGWIDFVSSIPALPIFGAGRVVRVIRIFRILRAFRSTKILIQFVYRRRSHGTLMTALIITVLLTIFSAIAMLNFETAPNSNIRTPDDALWWAATTITTVGYGDRYPVTDGGRVVAIFLMTAGVGLFAIFTGFITSFFREADQKKEEQALETLIDEIRLLRQKVESLERHAVHGGAVPNNGAAEASTGEQEPTRA
jgi:voltage-gated potassium channel